MSNEINEAMSAAIANNAETLVDLEEHDAGVKFDPLIRALKIYSYKRKSDDGVKFQVTKDFVVSIRDGQTLSSKIVEHGASAEAKSSLFTVSTETDQNLSLVAQSLIEQIAEHTRQD